MHRSLSNYALEVRVAAVPALRLLAAMVLTGAFLLGCSSSKSSPNAQTIQVSLTPAGCDPAAIQAKSGPTTFVVTNKNASGVTELEVLSGNHVLGEAENITPGLTHSFNITLQPGSYTLSCPGGTATAQGTLEVTGPAQATTAITGPVTTVNVAEKDFSITPAATSGPAGNFTFDISNAGPTTHEFVVVKTDLAANALPVQDDEVNEDDPRLQHIDELEDITTGTNTSLTVNLPPGHYVFMCNITGHYELGMHVDFTVQ